MKNAIEMNNNIRPVWAIPKWLIFPSLISERRRYIDIGTVSILPVPSYFHVTPSSMRIIEEIRKYDITFINYVWHFYEYGDNSLVQRYYAEVGLRMLNKNNFCFYM